MGRFVSDLLSSILVRVTGQYKRKKVLNEATLLVEDGSHCQFLEKCIY